MFVLRKIRENDFKRVMDLVMLAHSGITSLPKDKKLLLAKVQHSLESFRQDLWAPQNEKYLFVLEETETKDIVGISGIASKTGVGHPSYFYQIKEEVLPVKQVSNKKLTPQRVLIPSSQSNGPSENGSLFLNPQYRKEGLGKLLSLARFLFIASHRQRFDDIITANLRGIIKDDNSCPFWDNVGRRFLDVEFDTVQRMIQENPEIIPQILPRHPIYASLLRPSVQKLLGRPHPNSAPALRLTLKLNFTLTNEIDIFDGGPKVSAHVDSIPIVAKSNTARVRSIENTLSKATQVMICNNNIDFRAAMGPIKRFRNSEAAISEEMAKLLDVDVGDTIRYSSMR